MKNLIYALVFMSLPAFARPMTVTAVKRVLDANSPCFMAASTKASGGQIDSVVYCVMERTRNGKQECVLTGYDVDQDKFTMIPGTTRSDISVAQSCTEGGLEKLLAKKLNSGRLLAEYLANRSDILYAADEVKEILGLNGGLESVGGAASPVRGLCPGPKRGFGLTGGGGLESIQLETAKGMVCEERYTTVNVFYATDRAFTGSNTKPKDAFRNERSASGALSYGVAEVSIPMTHKRGSIERPSIFKFEFSENPEEHVVLKKVSQTPADRFFAEMQAKVNGSEQKDAFVFVHGFNVTFEGAAQRTAQIAYDLNFSGAPVMYTWPSGEKLHQYSAAEANAEWSFRHLEKFLKDVAQKSGAKRIHLIAHSMGNRVLTNAINAMQMQQAGKTFQQVVLTAPDIDTDTFDQIADSITKSAERVTIYASEHDEALKISKKFHANRRLGMSGSDIYLREGNDTVDASKCETSLVGHSYYGENLSVLDDLYGLLGKDFAPHQRNTLTPVKTEGGTYWQLKKPVGN